MTSPGYAAAGGVGLVLTVLWLRTTQRELGLPPLQRAGVLVGALVGAALGAKLPYLLERWRDVSLEVMLGDTGKTLIGGLAGGYLGVEAAKARLGITAKTGDSFAAPVALGIAWGRLGCFLGGCCSGLPTTLPLAVDFGDGVPRHPTQLYEAAFHLAAAGALVVLGHRGAFPRQRMKLYILAYLGFRFLTEWLRPEARVLCGLTAYQLACLGLAPVFLALWRLDAEPTAEPD